MNVLLLNGSPRRKGSNTLQISEAFLRGLARDGTHDVRRVDLYDQEIRPCLGCFRCWTASPGVCVHQDGMPALLEAYLAADLVIWSVPLYYYGLPAQAKAFMDRMLPLNRPQLVEVDGHCAHPSRYDLSSQQHLLISSCGYFTLEENYEALCKQFSILFGDRVQWILRSQGELLQQPALRTIIQRYFDQVEGAGVVWQRQGGLSAEILCQLEQPFFSPQAYMEMANASWEIAQAEQGGGKRVAGGESGLASVTDEARGTPPDAAFAFMRQMAATCNPAALEGERAVLEMAFTDLGTSYQLHMDASGCRAVKDAADFLPHSTRIETPLDVWKRISAGEISGSQAMMDGLYKTTGDFSLMLKMDRLFGLPPSGEGADTPVQRLEEGSRRTRMVFLLAPWLCLWNLAGWSALWSGALTALCCAALPLLARMGKSRLTLYDGLSSTLCAILAVLLLSGTASALVIPLSYLLCALLWLSSLLGKLPITAHYSAYDYGGTDMLLNPLFVKTNAILTGLWGAVYLAAAAANLILLVTPFSAYAGLLLLPLMGGMLLFTNWFQRWYPAKVARGK